MPITYPLALPKEPTARRVTISPQSMVAVSRSPFTGSQQVQRHQGQMWVVQVDLPPMLRAAAEQWNAWALKLNGQEGTFLMGMPSTEEPLGQGQGSPVVAGAGQAGTDLLTRGWEKPLDFDGLTCDSDIVTVDSTLYTCDSAQIALRAGDYIQLGSGTASRLYKVLDDAEITDAATGAAVLTVWPRLRGAPADGDAVTYRGAKGCFRLSSLPGWDIGEARIYGIQFEAVEAL